MIKSAPLLTVENLTRNFGGLVAIKRLDLSITAGEIVGLIGPNGSGKTTTLNLLSGFDKPTTGKIALRGERVIDSTPRAIFDLGVSRTFQAVRLFDSLTVAENVEVAALSAMQTRKRKPIRERVEQELLALGISDRAAELANSLPYGLRRRVEMARALVSDPALVLLDEPAAGMSRQETEELQKRIEEVRWERGSAFLVVEHDIQLIFDLCDRVVVLNTGEKIAEGSPEDIRDDPRVKESYIGQANA